MLEVSVETTLTRSGKRDRTWDIGVVSFWTLLQGQLKDGLRPNWGVSWTMQHLSVLRLVSVSALNV